MQNKLVDCLVTTAGGVEEDFIKCLGETVLGEFEMRGEGLRKRGWVGRRAKPHRGDRSSVPSLVAG